MSGLLEGYNLLHSKREESIKDSKKAEEQAQVDIDSEWQKREMIKERKELSRRNYVAFKEDVKTALLTECLSRVYLGSIKRINENEKAICASILNTYIAEQGTDKLLNSFHHKTLLLSEINRIVNKHYVSLVESADPEDSYTQTIDMGKMDDFYKDLDSMEDMDDVTNNIRIRVTNAEEEFITKNMVDKTNTEDILKSTADRIENIKADNSLEDDQAEEMQEEAARIAKDKIRTMKDNRTKTVFEQMVNKLSMSLYKNDLVKNGYLSESGGIDIDAVMESVRCMYTFMEMLGTARIENIDENFIKETLESI